MAGKLEHRPAGQFQVEWNKVGGQGPLFGRKAGERVGDASQLRLQQVDGLFIPAHCRSPLTGLYCRTFSPCQTFRDESPSRRLAGNVRIWLDPHARFGEPDPPQDRPSPDDVEREMVVTGPVAAAAAT